MWIGIAAALLLSSPPSSTKLAWIEDDWPKAKAQAVAEHKLVAIDVWATWCHSCLSMRNYVFNDKRFDTLAQKHTWLSLDYDKPVNAAFFAKFPVSTFPTFVVIDPEAESVAARWSGTGTAKEMVAFFGKADKKASAPLDLGERMLAEENYPGARAIFDEALKKPARDKTERTRILNGWAEATSRIDPKTCAEIGPKHFAEIENTAQGMDFVSMVESCASGADPDTKKRVMTAVVERLARVAEDRSDSMVVDDRSGVYEALADAYDELGEAAKAEKTVQLRAKLLEDAARKATTPAARATFDAHRLTCYLRLGRFDEAEKMLHESEQAQPDDYNHPARLALLYLKSGRIDEGLVAIDRALSKGYGPRRLRLYSTKIDLLVEKKQFDAARQTVAAAKAEMTALGKGQLRPGWVRELEAKADAIAKAEQRL
jgi:tetratricopeptide (TPR) repeat protein